jgi:serine/threonine protein kinase
MLVSASLVSPAHIIRTAQSLGCVLFALAYLRSPFETTQTTEQGGSIAMAVLNAQYKHPASNYSQGLKTLIDDMLKVNPQERPDIHQVILPHTLNTVTATHAYQDP